MILGSSTSVNSYRFKIQHCDDLGYVHNGVRRFASNSVHLERKKKTVHLPKMNGIIRKYMEPL